ncbi:citrate transporter [Acidovorax sp. Leaf76]|uniref:SLC13 family permease n=1 Tax=unclassified Acidovorax TaxID=2684926 RepID=UPI0006F85BB6|nr:MULTISPECIES: SLC13 family permease [unclassified Acidovorax]KQO26895.1 citrate transporter [Acidovorax sp. Leaf76]KQO40663.1 citrate transporter [Acidovorax sp. Leaf84]KQS42808.1 citrate transporter [Acidovorax sp. Leaf191]
MTDSSPARATAPATSTAPSHSASSAADEAPGGGNGLLWVLVAVAVLFAVLRPRAPMDYLRLVDWQTVGALAGLLAITQGVEKSGMLQATAQRLLGRMTDLRSLAMLLTAGAAVLSALVTNDVSLFLLVPLTRVLATQADLPLARLVVLQALAVNAGSALTPIGNPQNLYLWHRSGESFVGFMGMMAPTVAIMLFWLFVAVWVLVPRTAITLRPATEVPAVQPRLLTLAGVLFVAFVVALERHWLVAGLALVFGAFVVFYPRVLKGVDWALLAIIALMFVDLRQLADLPAVASLLQHAPIAEGWRAYLAAIVASQFISNVPAAILLDGPVRDLPALAAGVSVGGFGCVLGSLANLIALRLARLPHGLREFHKISIPFLIVCALSALWLRMG